MNTVRPARPEDSAAWLRMRCALWPEGSEREHATEIAAFFAGKAHMPLAVLLAFDDSKAPWVSRSCPSAPWRRAATQTEYPGLDPAAASAQYSSETSAVNTNWYFRYWAPM